MPHHLSTPTSLSCAEEFYMFCISCFEEKEEKEMIKSKSAKSGFGKTCKLCKAYYDKVTRLIKTKKIFNEKPEKQTEYLIYLYSRNKSISYCADSFNTDINNIEKVLDDWNILNKSFCKQCNKWIDQKDFHPAENKKCGRQSICKNCWKINTAKRYKNNKVQHRKTADKWVSENIERNRAYKTKWTRNKYQTDPTYRVHSNMSSMIFQALREKKNLRCWETLVGYTKEQLMVHLEEQFVEGMTWDNYGRWHIDHKRPRSKFNIDSAEDIEFRKCWSLDNLQPLWAKDNLSKGNQY
jgi:hypothetical protein